VGVNGQQVSQVAGTNWRILNAYTQKNAFPLAILLNCEQMKKIIYYHYEN